MLSFYNNGLKIGAQCQIRTGTLIASDSKSEVSTNSTNWANFCILHYNLILSRVLCKIFVKSVFFKDRRSKKNPLLQKDNNGFKIGLVPDARFELARQNLASDFKSEVSADSTNRSNAYII